MNRLTYILIASTIPKFNTIYLIGYTGCLVLIWHHNAHPLWLIPLLFALEGLQQAAFKAAYEYLKRFNKRFK